MLQQAPLRADSLPVLFRCSRRQPTSPLEGVVILLQISCQSLRTTVSAQGTLLAFSALQASGSTYLTCFGPDGAAVQKFAKHGQTAGLFWPTLAATITFARVDVEPTMKLAAATVAWEAATEIYHSTPRIVGVDLCRRWGVAICDDAAGWR